MTKKRDLYWGWYVVLGAFLILGINYGARYCFGVFVKPMSLEYGWSRSVISLGASFMILSYGIGGIVSGYLLDRMAPRLIITIGEVIAAAGLILTGFIQTPWQFYLSYGVLCGAGTSCFGVVVCNASVGKWFIAKRGLAMGTASVGVGVGTMMLSPLLGYIVQVSWRTGFVFLGLTILAGVIALAQGFMKKTHPEAYGLQPTACPPRHSPPRDVRRPPRRNPHGIPVSRTIPFGRCSKMPASGF
jgi:sugar phosphate permease